MSENSARAFAIADHPAFRGRVVYLCLRRALVAIQNNDVDKALYIAAYKTIVASEGNITTVCQAILVTPAIIAKVTESNAGSEATDNGDLWPLIQTNLLILAELCA